MFGLRKYLLLLWLISGNALGGECISQLEQSFEKQQWPSAQVRENCLSEARTWYRSNDTWVSWVFSGIGIALPIALIGIYINHARHSRKHDELVKTIRDLQSQLEELKPKADLIPDGIRLGEKVLQIPTLSWVFDRALWIQHCRPEMHPIMNVEAGQWVKRGDPIYTFPIRTASLFWPSFTDRTITHVVVPSPVDGIFIGGTPFNENLPIAILMPDDEPDPLGTSYIFRNLCAFCIDHFKFIYLKPSEFKATRESGGEEIRSALKKQRETEYKVADLWQEYEWVPDWLKAKDTGYRRALPAKPSDS